MKMKESILSITTGSAASLIASISGADLIEAVICAFIGGMAAYGGQLLLKSFLKKIGLNKKQKNYENEEN
jgi:hypothetical protein